MGKRTWVVAVAAVIILIVVYLLRRGGEDFVPVTTDIPADQAKVLYDRCNRDVMANLVEFRHPNDETDHPGLSLGTMNRVAKNRFGELFDDAQRRLIGAIRNNAPQGDDIGAGWKTTPGRLLCIFMGGDVSGLFAYVVWEKDGLFTGRKREVAARFRMVAHSDDMAKWDEPIEGRTEVTFDLVPGRLTREWPSREGGPGTWYTCATNTCCKVL